MRALRGCLLITLTLLLSPGAMAQSVATGTIAGVVRDASGGVLPGVTVEAASPALIEKTRTVVTDGQLRLVPGASVNTKPPEAAPVAPEGKPAGGKRS